MSLLMVRNDSTGVLYALHVWALKCLTIEDLAMANVRESQLRRSRVCAGFSHRQYRSPDQKADNSTQSQNCSSYSSSASLALLLRFQAVR